MARSDGGSLSIRLGLFFFLIRLVHNVLIRYEKKVKDYNFGCLIRTDARGEYGETNTMFGASSAVNFLLVSQRPSFGSHAASGRSGCTQSTGGIG